MKVRKASREEKDTVLLNAEIPRELKERLDKYVEKEGLKIRAVVIKALDEFLRSKGY
jgi:hypothetical protein